MNIEHRESEKPEFLDAYQLSILRPGGNDTCLVWGIVRDQELRRTINDSIMNRYSNVEQVGFINLEPNNIELMMAGGEFCGNATRSTAWIYLQGEPGEIEIKVSGVNGKLKAGVNESGEAWAQMPIYPDLSRVSPDLASPGNFIVEMEGITHYIAFNSEAISGLDDEAVKEVAFNKIKSEKLDQYPAAGVIYMERLSESWKMSPVVYVRDINTLYYETACGSGAIAFGLTLAKLEGRSIDKVPVIQPSGLPIRVTVRLENGIFTYAQIEGPIQQLLSGSAKI